MRDVHHGCTRDLARNGASTLWPVWKTTHLAPMQSLSSLGAAVSSILDAFENGYLVAGFRTPIRSGSAAGVVAVIDSPDDPGIDTLTVRLPIMRVPAHGQAEFYLRLLDLNTTLYGRASFSVSSEGVVILTAGRNVRDLEPDELVDLIIWTAEQADHLDDLLLEEFGYEHRLNPDG